MIIFLVKMHIIIIDYHFHVYDSAAEIITQAKQFSSQLNCVYTYSMYLFYQGLISITQMKKAQSEDTSIWKHLLNQSISWLEAWSETAPENFKVKLMLLIAEKHGCVSNDHIKALELYNEAIGLSRDYNQSHAFRGN